MKKVHYYPAPSFNGKYANPYSTHYREELSKYFKVVDTQARKGFLLPFQLVWSALTKADIYIFNWIENFTYHYLKVVQYFMIILCFQIIKWRKKKLVWMFHNMQPHGDLNKYSNKIMSYLFLNSDLIITHSKEATRYAQSKSSNSKVLYRCHPITAFINEVPENKCPKYDVLIWGAILPYKGIVEFLTYLNSAHSELNVSVVGKCKDEALTKAIKEQCNEHITFSNEHIDFKELLKQIRDSKFVVFPYIGNSISSSGALIDTIAMGGNAVGPNKGAFKDIAEEGCCYVYNSYENLIKILKGNNKIKESARQKFLSDNSWENFVKSIINELNI